MDELISLINKAYGGGRLILFEVGIHNMKDKKSFTSSTKQN